MDQLIQTFVQEADELLGQMEDALLSLEENPTDAELLNSLFRAMHTIKGAAGIFGFDPVVSFTHPVETELDRVRSGKRPLDPELSGLLLQCKDHTARLVEMVTQNTLDKALLAAGADLLRQVTGQSPPLNANNVPQAGSEADQWLISLSFHETAFRNGIDPISFIRYLSGMGEILDLITTQDRLPPLEDFDPESCYLSFDIVFKGTVSKADIASVFEFAEDDCDINILAPAALEQEFLQLIEQLPEERSQRLGEMLLALGAITKHELNRSLNRQREEASTPPSESPEAVRPVGALLVERGAVSPRVVDKALERQQQVRQKATQEAQLVRVDAEKLGRLINLVGELVISNAAIRVQAERHGLGDLQEVLASAEHLVENIRDTALQLRMVQIGETFSRFKRVVHDVSKELGKDIELVIRGGETELDKTVIEKITDPLTHLVRNALDHGIESPAARKQAGKPGTGTLTLNAYHDSGHIVLQILDDGAGLNAGRIRAKAEAIGLVRPDQVLTDAEVWQLIFAPGLTTKDQANNLSGRGVGMDVVRRNIEALRGQIDIHSELGAGTCITIHLPLTLAIIDGFMVGAQQERYVIPLAMVEECLEMNAQDWAVDEEHHCINLRGEVLPYLRLANFLNIPQVTQAPLRETLVVVRVGTHRAGFVVDELYGELQTVIKPLGRLFQHFKGISGSTVLGTGEVALILDVQGLIQSASAQMVVH